MKTNIHPLLRILSFLIVITALVSCGALQKAATSVGLSPATQTAVKVTLQQDAATALADIVAGKSSSAILTDETAATLTSISNQAQAQGGDLAVVEITAAGQALLKDYLAKASTSQEISDVALAGLKALTNANPAAAP